MAKPIAWTVQDIIEATSGVLISGDADRMFSTISIDSRNITDNDLFIAIKGLKHDGHRFVADVTRQGVSGLVVNRDQAEKLPSGTLTDGSISCVAVKDTTRALGDLAMFQRKRSGVSVIAITGSNGKTTTKEMTSAVLNTGFDTLSTRGNLNNDIGLPLTLFRLTAAHQWAVVELGMNRPGEISRLSEICGPDIGVITNIGPAHLEGVGSIEGVMNAKGEMLENIHPDGKAVLNADDPMVMQLAEKSPRDTLLFGLSETATVRAQSIKKHQTGQSFELRLPDDTISVNLDLPGDFIISNALAAAAAGHLAGLNAVSIKTGLESFKSAPGRMNMFTTLQGIHVIDDSYNANPESMKTAISVLSTVKGQNRTFAVLGDMFELGAQAETMHETIGTIAAASGVDKLYASGNFAEKIAKGARDEGMASDNIVTGTKAELLADLMSRVKRDDWVLVKGSRAMGMEDIVKGLKAGNE